MCREFIAFIEFYFGKWNTQFDTWLNRKSREKCEEQSILYGWYTAVSYCWHLILLLNFNTLRFTPIFSPIFDTFQCNIEFQLKSFPRVINKNLCEKEAVFLIKSGPFLASVARFLEPHMIWKTSNKANDFKVFFPNLRTVFCSSNVKMTSDVSNSAPRPSNI